MADAKILQLADAVVSALNGATWPQGVNMAAVWLPLPLFDLQDLPGLHVTVIAGHDAASFTTDPGQTAGKTDVAIVLQQQLAADSLEDDVAALLDIEQGILDLFLGKRLASYSGEALCRTAEQLGYDLPALKEKLEFLGIVTLTLDLLDD